MNTQKFNEVDNLDIEINETEHTNIFSIQKKISPKAKSLLKRSILYLILIFAIF